jgi:hypothetical protein
MGAGRQGPGSGKKEQKDAAMVQAWPKKKRGHRAAMMGEKNDGYCQGTTHLYMCINKGDACGTAAFFYLVRSLITS